MDVLARASEQFRQSDVTIWAIVALGCSALAVFGSNISLLVPQSIIGGLHQPRVASASIETLRMQVSNLMTETTKLKNDNASLLSRFTMQERTSNDAVRRIGALEVTVPSIVESLAEGTPVDRSNLTASVNSNETLTFDADGGSVAVRQSTLPEARQPVPVPNQPLPAPITQQQTSPTNPAPNAYGVAVGAAVPATGTDALWSDLTLKLGPLLFGLVPLVADTTDGTAKHIVVGPISSVAEARSLCERFERISIACVPSPYSGVPLLAEAQ